MRHIKNLLIFAALFFSFTLSAQLSYDAWEKVETTDDFGDKTGDSVLRTFSEGTFSNSATAGSELIVKVSDYGDSAFMTLYEYGSTPARLSLKSAFGKIKVKLPNGEVVSFNTFSPKSGGLLFSKDDYTELFKYLKDGTGGVLKFVINESAFSDYGSAKYSFSLTSMTAKEKTDYGVE